MTNETDKQNLMPDVIWAWVNDDPSQFFDSWSDTRIDNNETKYIRADLTRPDPAPVPEDRQKALEWFDCKYQAKDNHEEAEIINTIRAALVSSETAINLKQTDLCKVRLKQNALEPKPSVDVDGFWKLEPLAQLIQDEFMNLGCTAIASECEDIAHKIRSQGYLNTQPPSVPDEVVEALNKLAAKMRQKKGFYSVSVGNSEVRQAHKAGILKGLDAAEKEINAALSLLTAQEGK